MFDLSHLNALVTGASGGIGGSVARMLHQRGATLVISGTRQEPLEKLAHELKERVHVIPCDLSDVSSVEKLIPEAEKCVGSVDILVNNAGITRDSLMLRMKDEDWQLVMDVNLGSVFRLCRAAVRGMMKKKFGRIINISSIMGFAGNAGQVNYCASKAGVIGLSKSLAREVSSRGITVNCVAPGYIQTSMTDVVSEQVKHAILNNIPLGRLGTPDDVAFAVLYLASKEASYVTGETMHVNGGLAMY